MFKKSFLLIGFLSSLCASGQTVFSQQRIGNTTFTSSGGTTVIQGPSGITVIDNSADAFSGTWSGGMQVSLSRVLSKEHLPQKLIIKNFELKMNDGREMVVLAATAKENDLPSAERSAVIWGRAAKVCELTNTHKYPLAVETSSKWLGGLLIDVTANSSPGQYSTYLAESLFSGTRFFTEVTCSQVPRGY